MSKHESIQDLDDTAFSFKIVPTTCGISSKSKMKQPVEFYINDAVTFYLFKSWYFAHAPEFSASHERHSKKFFLPCITKGKGFDFCKPFSYDNHKQACLDLVATLGWDIPACMKAKYGSNCVRRGLAATLGCQFRQVLAQHNKFYGRSLRSKIDLDVYCPDEVLQMPGPLFCNHDEIDLAWTEFTEHQLVDIKALKCHVCGFPKCTCIVCCTICNAVSNLKTHTKVKHSCMLGNLGKPFAGSAAQKPNRY